MADPVGDAVVPGLSGIVITKNEARNLEACLESLGFCEEILVVDSGSTDGTQAIARRRGARLVEREWPGYGPQKEFARLAAKGEWVLSLDADERVTTALRDEIEKVLADPSAEAYEMPRLSTFLGREMRHSGWWPDHCLRLFRRDSVHFSSDLVHESAKTERKVGRLVAHLEHHPVRDLDSLIRKIDDYSALGARMLAERSRPVGPMTPLARGSFAFLKTYILKRGFLDGPEGLINAAAHAQTVFWKYARAWEIQRARGKAQAEISDA